MLFRPKPYAVGDRIRLKDCHAYPLPPWLPAGTEAVVTGRDIGRTIVRVGDDEWNLAMQNIDSGSEFFLNGQWLDASDRRVQKARARGKL